MTRPTDVLRYGETVRLVRCDTGGPPHVVPGSCYSHVGVSRAVCPARPMGRGEGPMYLDEALERDVCGHCRRMLERARREREQRAEAYWEAREGVAV